MASKEFSKKLKELRLRAGFSQKQVYEHFDIPQSTFSSWEVGKSEPSGDMLLKLCEYYECDMLKEFSQENSSGITYEELKIIKKYRSLSPYDQETVTTLLNRLHDREESRNIIEYTSTSNSLNRFIPYQHSASAGSGIYILGNEAADQLAIPIGPEYDDVDYAVRVNGDSMSPDFNDGDAALVSQRKEMNIGDVGIFVKNGEAFIKELGETELISRNPEYPNIPVMEDDNVVCLGKVIGKLQV